MPRTCGPTFSRARRSRPALRHSAAARASMPRSVILFLPSHSSRRDLLDVSASDSDSTPLSVIWLDWTSRRRRWSLVARARDRFRNCRSVTFQQEMSMSVRVGSLSRRRWISSEMARLRLRLRRNFSHFGRQPIVTVVVVDGRYMCTKELY